MKKLISVPIEVESIGENKIFLHMEIGTGKLGIRKVRLIQGNKGTLIFQVYSLNGKSWKSYTISPDAVSKAFIKAYAKFEKNGNL